MDLRQQILEKYGTRYHTMLKHIVRWESGKDLDKVMYNDAFWYGDISTPANRKLIGYTDGVTGYSQFDSGGETKYGFAQNAHNNIVVRDLIFPDVVDLYYTLYAVPVRYTELQPKTADLMLDIAVGSGTGRAIKMLQKTIGVTEDGAFGPITLTFANSHNDDALFELLNAERKAFYRRIVWNKPTQGIYLDGWLNRANDLEKIV